MIKPRYIESLKLLRLPAGKASLNNLSFIFLFIVFFSISLYCQPGSSGKGSETNLEAFYSLVDSAANAALAGVPDIRFVKLNYNFGNIYSVFGNRLIEDFNRGGKKIIVGSNNDSSVTEMNFVIDTAFINYGRFFRKKLFGDFYTTRTIILGGSYSIMKPVAAVKSFSFTLSDTVNADQIQKIENSAFPFTQAPVPAEPFFSTIYEPVIAVGAAALTVILFFTVRSK